VEAVLPHSLCGVVGRADTLLFLSRVVVPDVKKSRWLFDSEAEKKE